MNAMDSVLQLKNVGEQRKKILRLLGIETIGELVERFPRTYEDRSEVTSIGSAKMGELVTVRAAIQTIPEVVRIHQTSMVRVKVKDETGSVWMTWFNQSYLKSFFQEGTEYYFTGKLDKKYGKVQMLSPDYERADKDCTQAGSIIPVYSLVHGLSQKIFRSLVQQALQELSDQWTDCIPVYIRQKYSLCEKNFSVMQIHFPQNKESFLIARRRLVFEELFLLQLALFRLKKEAKEQAKAPIFANVQYEALTKTFQFSLTNAQRKVIGELIEDFRSGFCMNRLVQGDVGSGKTAVAMVAAYAAIQCGYQAVLMAPTELLAQQHMETVQQYFAPLQIQTVLLTGGMTKKEKDAALFQIASGQGQMIIGTHAVIQKTVIFQKLGLVITDEQHRFGVRQRRRLVAKGESPHALVMTATPIPRTLALILYGDLDISVLDEMPPGRQKIETLVVTDAYHNRIYDFIKREVANGQQAYVICPVIEEGEKQELRAVVTYEGELKKKLHNLNVKALHGKMKQEEKQNIMEQFINREIDVLVTTTVIEVGINVPNATIMLIENAERFGLAQLHQLRGRVGRGAAQSYCILVSDAQNTVAKERLDKMKHAESGFEIAESDLTLRGPGEFFGTRQHGLPELKIANLYQDIELLKQAQQASADVYAHAWPMNEEEETSLSEQLTKLFPFGSIGM